MQAECNIDEEYKSRVIFIPSNSVEFPKNLNFISREHYVKMIWFVKNDKKVRILYAAEKENTFGTPDFYWVSFGRFSRYNLYGY